MGLLVGDTTGNGSVNGSDVAHTKTNAGHAVDASNFRADVNACGSITATDIGVVKSMSGTALPQAKTSRSGAF
jgi:Dockerin type I domain